jgi:hypothetical protein
MRGTTAEPWMNESVHDGPYEVETAVFGWWIEHDMYLDARAEHEHDHDHLMCLPTDETPLTRGSWTSEEDGRIFRDFRMPQVGDRVTVTVPAGARADHIPDEETRAELEHLYQTHPDHAEWEEWLQQPGVYFTPETGDEPLTAILIDPVELPDTIRWTEFAGQIRVAADQMAASFHSQMEAVRHAFNQVAQVFTPGMSRELGQILRQRLLASGSLRLTDWFLNRVPHAEEALEVILDDLEYEMTYDQASNLMLITIYHGERPRPPEGADWQFVGYSSDGSLQYRTGDEDQISYWNTRRPPIRAPTH